MPRYSDDPVRHIVTFRINEEEKKILDALAKKSGRTISEVMRHRVQTLCDRKATKGSSPCRHDVFTAQSF